MLSYPCKKEDANLSVIATLKQTFPNCVIGYSDHVAPDENMTVISTAYLLGADIIEKHFTLDKTLKGNDYYHVGDPNDFRKIVTNLELIDVALGNTEITVLDCELIPRREARRSLVLTRDMKAGEIIKESDLMSKRPGTGISPEYLDIVIGRQVKTDLAEDTVLTWEML